MTQSEVGGLLYTRNGSDQFAIRFFKVRCCPSCDCHESLEREELDEGRQA